MIQIFLARMVREAGNIRHPPRGPGRCSSPLNHAVVGWLARWRTADDISDEGPARREVNALRAIDGRAETEGLSGGGAGSGFWHIDE